jgi:hypothetical protein
MATGKPCSAGLPTVPAVAGSSRSRAGGLRCANSTAASRIRRAGSSAMSAGPSTMAGSRSCGCRPTGSSRAPSTRWWWTAYAGTFTSDTCGSASLRAGVSGQLSPAEMGPVSDIDDVSLGGRCPAGWQLRAVPATAAATGGRGLDLAVAADARPGRQRRQVHGVRRRARGDVGQHVRPAANAEASLAIGGFAVGGFTTDEWGSTCPSRQTRIPPAAAAREISRSRWTRS